MIPGRRNRRGRRRLFRLLYFIVFLVGLGLVYALTPSKVIQAVKDTYINPSVDLDQRDTTGG